MTVFSPDPQIDHVLRLRSLAIASAILEISRTAKSTEVFQWETLKYLDGVIARVFQMTAERRFEIEKDLLLYLFEHMTPKGRSEILTAAALSQFSTQSTGLSTDPCEKSSGKPEEK